MPQVGVHLDTLEEMVRVFLEKKRDFAYSLTEIAAELEMNYSAIQTSPKLFEKY